MDFSFTNCVRIAKFISSISLKHFLIVNIDDQSTSHCTGRKRIFQNGQKERLIVSKCVPNIIPNIVIKTIL